MEHYSLLLTPTGILSAISVITTVPYRFCLPGCAKNNSRRSYAFCLIMAVIPLIAFAMAHRTSKPGWQVGSLWPKTLIALVFSYGAMLHYSAIGFPGIPYGSGTILFGWDYFAQQIEDEVGSITDLVIVDKMIATSL